MTIKDLTPYYSSLLAFEYRGLPNASRQMELWTKQVLADYVAGGLLTCYDVDLAEGAQLDILGKYAGIPRNIGVVLTRPYFGFWSTSNPLDVTLCQGAWDPTSDTPSIPAAASGNNGWWYAAKTSGASASPIVATWLAGDVIVSNGSVWTRSTAANTNGLATATDLGVNVNSAFFSANFLTGQNSDLSDAQYRVAIKLKIILNANDGTLATIMVLLQQFFPGQVFLTDNKNMTMDYIVVSTVPLSKELLEVYLPRPMGVGITVTIVDPTPPVTGGHILTESGDPLTTESGDPIITESI